MQANAKYDAAQEQAKSGGGKIDPSAKGYVIAAQGALEQSEAELNEAKINLENTFIKSPIKGVIIARRVNVGQNVAPDPNAPSLFLIAKDLGRMHLASVNEADIGRIHEGMTAHFTVDAFPKDVFEGKVTANSPECDLIQNTVNIQ